MRAKRLHVFAALAAGTAGLFAIAACSSSETIGFEEAPDSAGEAGASLPPQTQGDAAIPSDGDMSLPPVDETVVCSVTPCVTQITAGSSHYCARISDGTVRCWGNNSRGQLGSGETDGGFSADAGPNPGTVDGLTDVVQIDAASATTCAVSKDGGVKCWGDNKTGGIGTVNGSWNEDTAPHPVPQAVALPGPARRVDLYSLSSAFVSACATIEGGELWCWGANGADNVGYLARSTLKNTMLAGPGLADRLAPYSGLRFGTAGGPFVITKDQHLVEWATLSGRDTVANAANAYPIALPLEGVTSFSSSESHACAIVQGQVECWTHGVPNVYICDGTGTNTTAKLPTLAKTRGNASPRELALGLNTNGTCVRMSDGTVQCCGDNVNGGLATGDTQLSMIFTEAKALEGRVVQIAASENSKCALLKTGEVKCWGGNKLGELGQRTTDSDPHPVPLTVKLP